MTAVWRHTSKIWHNLKKLNSFKMFLIILNNFYHDKHCLKIMLRWQNTRLSPKITRKTAKWQMYDVTRQKRDMIRKGNFFQIVPLIMLSNFYHDQHCLKIKLRWRNRRLTQKITEKRQNDGCMTSYVKIGTWYEIKKNFKMFLWSCWATFTMLNMAWKSSWGDETGD